MTFGPKISRVLIGIFDVLDLFWPIFYIAQYFKRTKFRGQKVSRLKLTANFFLFAVINFRGWVLQVFFACINFRGRQILKYFACINFRGEKIHIKIFKAPKGPWSYWNRLNMYLFTRFIVINITILYIFFLVMKIKIFFRFDLFFTDINFRGWPNLKYFADINFRGSMIPEFFAA